jgi:integrase
MPRKNATRADGDGSIYQDGDRWRAYLIIDGKPVRRSAPDEKTANRKLQELIKLRDSGVEVGTGKMKLSAWLERWLDILTEAGKKAKTIDGHRESIRLYINPYLGERRLDAIRASHIDDWRRQLRERERKLRDSTIAGAHRRLSAAFNMAVKRRMIAHNPCKQVEALTVGRRRILALDTDQVAQLLDTLTREQHRLYPLFVLACTTGMRQGELIGLRVGSLTLTGEVPELVVREQLQRITDPKTGKKVLHRQTPKGEDDKSHERTIPLSTLVAAVLRAHLARLQLERRTRGELAALGPDDLVFTTERGTPINDDNLRRTLTRACKRAQLPRVTFHSLRHSAGSVMLARGAQLIDVSAILGHSSPLITARIYAHAFDAGKRHAADLASVALLRKGA